MPRKSFPLQKNARRSRAPWKSSFSRTGVPRTVPGKRVYHHPVDRRDISEQIRHYERRIAYMESLAKQMRGEAVGKKADPREPQSLALAHLATLNVLYREMHGPNVRPFELRDFWQSENIVEGVKPAERIGSGMSHSPRVIKTVQRDTASSRNWAGSFVEKMKYLSPELTEKPQRKPLSLPEVLARAEKAAAVQTETMVRWIKQGKIDEARTMLNNLRELLQNNPALKRKGMDAIRAALKNAQENIREENVGAAAFIRTALSEISPRKNSPSKVSATISPSTEEKPAFGMRTPTRATIQMRKIHQPALAKPTAEKVEEKSSGASLSHVKENSSSPELSLVKPRGKNEEVLRALRKPGTQLIIVLQKRLLALAAAEKDAVREDIVNVASAKKNSLRNESSQSDPVTKLLRSPTGREGDVEHLKGLPLNEQLRQRFAAHPRSAQRDMRALLRVARDASIIYLRMRSKRNNSAAAEAMRVQDIAMTTFWKMLRKPSK